MMALAHRLKPLTLLGLAFFMPISQRISTLLIFVLLGLSLITYQRHSVKLCKPALLLPLLYFLYCFSLLYSTELQTRPIEYKASFLVIPLIFFLNKSFTEQFDRILKYFILGCAVAVIGCELHAFWSAINFETWSFDYKIPETDTSNAARESINLFLGELFSFLHQGVYFAMYLCFSIAILLHRNIFHKKLQWFFLVLFALGVFQTLRKMGLLVLATLILTKLFHLYSSRKQGITIIALLLGLCTAFFVFNPRLRNFNTNFKIDQSKIKIHDFRKIPLNPKNRTQTNTRILLWTSAMEFIRQHPWIGIGAGGSHKRLYESYAVKRQWYDASKKFHAHNQYLQILLDVGIIGFISFGLILVFLIRSVFSKTDHDKRIVVLYFVLICGINFLTESIFERYSGVSFYAFFVTLILHTMYRESTHTEHIPKSSVIAK